MTHDTTARRRRLLVVWILTVALCAAAVAAGLLFSPVNGRVFGFDTDTLLDGAAYVTLFVVAVITFRWFQTAPRRMKPITVRDLRNRAGYGD